MPDFTVPQLDPPPSLLDFLRQQIPNAPTAYLRQLVKKGKVLRQGGPLTEEYALQPGDLIQLPQSARLLELLEAPAVSPVALQILYESREILVVDKPAGLAVHAGEGHREDNLQQRVSHHLESSGRNFQVAPVQRLDLETSGPVLFGKGRRACAELGKLLMQHQVDKIYLALVLGKTAGSGALESQLKAKGKRKEARSSFRALARNNACSLLEVGLHTGRQHQIRRQLADEGHPLFGDRRYGGPCPDQLPRLFLHCSRLHLLDPFSGALLEIDSPLPDELQQFLLSQGLDVPGQPLSSS